jgi:peptidoglycan biosynthesis protein MviN/MurJ (putative lipid II flippase)
VTKRRQPLSPIRPGWTVKRAGGIGVVAGLAALVLSLFYPGWPGMLRIPYFLAAAVAAACGLSILWMTAVDRFRYHRQRRVPLRVFDVVLALLLALPSLWAISGLLAEG